MEKFPSDTIYKPHTFFRHKEHRRNYSAILTLQTGNYHERFYCESTNNHVFAKVQVISSIWHLKNILWKRLQESWREKLVDIDVLNLSKRRWRLRLRIPCAGLIPREFLSGYFLIKSQEGLDIMANWATVYYTRSSIADFSTWATQLVLHVFSSSTKMFT